MSGRKLAAAAVLLLAQPAVAQPQAEPSVEPWRLADAVGAPDWLSLTGSARARYETLDGQPRAGLSPSDQLVSLRTAIIADADLGRLRLFGELQDSRVYLADADGGASTREVDALEPIQAYAAYALPDLLGEGSTASFSAGRMAVILGSRRLASADEYRNATPVMTGFKLDLETAGGTTATLISMFPQVVLPDDGPSLRDNEVELDRESGDLQFYGGLVTLPLAASAKLELSAYGLKEKDRSDLATRDRRLGTAGARLFRDPAPGTFDFDAEGFLQWGGVSASLAPGAARQDVEASFLHLEAGYSWDLAWRPRLNVELDWATGDDAATAGDFERFDPLFGSRRSELAPSGLYAILNRTNLVAPGVRFEVAPTRRLDAFVTVKALGLESATDSFSASGVRDVTGVSGDDAGVQVDARVRYWLIPDQVRLELDAIVLDKGSFYDTAPNSPGSEDTTFLSLNVTASF